jgi:O-antigen ligase
MILSGQFALDRVDYSLERLGVLGQARVWLFLPLALWVVFSRARGTRLPSFRQSSGKFFWAVVALHVYLAISALWTPRVLEASEMISNASEVCGVLLLAATVLMVPAIFRGDTRRKVDFFLGLALGASILYAIGGLFGEWREEDRIAAFGGGPNVFVRIVGMGVLVAIYFWLRTRRVIWLAPLPLLIGSAILSGSRGGILALGIGISVLLALCWRSIDLTLRRGAVVACALLILLSLSFLRETVFPYWQQRFVENSYEDRNDSDRLLLFSEAVAIIQENPVSGVGLDGFRRLSVIGEYSHNLFLQVTSEAGLIGLVLLLISLIAASKAWSWSSALEEKILLSLGVLFFFAQMFSGSYYDARYMWIFFGLILGSPRISGRVKN